MKRVVIYTDGACSGNPGVGGWGAVLIYGEAKKEISGAEKMTTNNRMELTAAIKALELLREPCEVELYTVCFGSEDGCIQNLKAAAGLLVRETEPFQSLLGQGLRERMLNVLPCWSKVLPTPFSVI